MMLPTSARESPERAEAHSPGVGKRIRAHWSAPRARTVAAGAAGAAGHDRCANLPGRSEPA
eukprot:14217430-Alexandrium_andersonii.AAC.1